MLKKFEQWLVENMVRFITCFMIALVSVDQLFMHIPIKDLYGASFVIVLFVYLAVIGLVRELDHYIRK